MHKSYLRIHTEHFATDRATPLAQARGAITKTVPEVLSVCVYAAGRYQVAAPLISRAAEVVIAMGCGDACPVSPATRYLDRDLPGPVHQPLEVVHSPARRPAHSR